MIVGWEVIVVWLAHMTYNKIKALFAWPNLKEDVKNYVAKCVCQQAKLVHSTLPGLLQPLPVPQQA